MNLSHHYATDVARKHARMTQRLHRTAWADLWAQGIPFFSPELAFHWRELRHELLTFWQPLGDEVRLADLRQDLDCLAREDEGLRAAYEQAQGIFATHLCLDRDDDGLCQGACDWEATHADDLRDQAFDVQRQEAGL